MEKIKIYFEDGQMKIRIPDESSLGRYKFLHEIYPVHREWTNEKNVMYVVNESSWKYVIQVAKYASNRDTVEITQDVEDYHQYLVRVEKERAERQYRLEALKNDIEKANSKQRLGCGWCEHLEYANAHWQEVNGERVWVSGRHYCKYANSVCHYKAFDVEREFYERREAKYYNPPPGYNPPAFIAPPYPCAGCMYLEKAEKALEEINKEKEKDV